MKVVWICGLPNDVRLNGAGHVISPIQTPAWSWILGHLPPPADVELHIICPVLSLESERVDFDYLGAHWHCVRQDRFEMLFLWRRVYKKMQPIVSSIKPDVVHGWGGETGCGYLATHLSRHAIVSVQGLLLLYQILIPGEPRNKLSFISRVKEWLFFSIERWSYTRARVRLVESNLAHDALSKYYAGLESVVVPHPLRKSFFEDKVSAETRVGRPVSFLFLGALVKRKGASDALAAFISAGLKNARLVMIGDGPLLPDIKTEVLKHHLENSIEIHPSCSAAQIVSFMNQSHFFLLPSYGDTGPTALKEALACGLYPICYDNSGPHELIRGYCGALVETGHVEKLTIAIRQAYQNCDKLTVESAVVAGRVRDDLSPTTVWKKLLSIYEEVKYAV